MMKKHLKLYCTLLCICMLFAHMSIGTFASEAEGKGVENPPVEEDSFDDEQMDDENLDDENTDEENLDDEAADDEKSDDESSDDESADGEKSDESSDDEKSDDEKSDDEKSDDESSDDESTDDETTVEAPAAPQNVVTYAGAKAILIAWDEAEDVDGYEVFVVEDGELVSVAKTSENEYLFNVSEEQEEESCAEYVLLVCSYKGEAYSEYTEEDYLVCELVDPMNMITNISHEYVDGTITFRWDVEGYLKDMAITRAEDESSVVVEEDVTEVVFENANPGETWTLTFATVTADDVEVTAEYIAVIEEEEQAEYCTCDICLDWYRRNPQ